MTGSRWMSSCRVQFEGLATRGVDGGGLAFLIPGAAIASQKPHCHEVLEAVESLLVIGLVLSSCVDLPEVLDFLLQLDHLELTSDGQSLETLKFLKPLQLLGFRLLTVRDIDQPAD